MTEQLRVAVIGTGRMGSAMVARLRSAGADVTLFNRTRAKADHLARTTGAVVAETPGRAAAAAPVVLVSLADDRALAETYTGPGGITESVLPGTVVADTSTVDPQTSRELGQELARRGAWLIDAPVSGSVPAVRQGELTVLAGGDAAALDRARPVLDVLARKIFHVGPSGAGAAMKLAVNTVVHGLNGAISEALVLAERAGVARGTAYDVFTASAAGAPFVQYKRTAFMEPAQAPVAFTVNLVAKDLDLALALAERLRVPLPQTVANRQVVAAAVDDGMGERDMAALAELLRDKAERSH